MLKLNRIIVFILLMLASTSVLAVTNLSYDPDRIPKKLQNTSDATKYSYQFAMDACQSSYFDKAFDVFDRNQTQTREMLMNLNVSHIKSRIKMKGASPTVNFLLAQTGFYWALNDCYGKQEWKKVVFVLGLATSDAASNFTGIAQGALMWLGPSKIFNSLVKYGLISQATRNILLGTIVGGGAIFIGSDIRDRYKARQKQKENLVNKQTEIIQDYEAILRLIEQEKNVPNSTNLSELIALKEDIQKQGSEIGLTLN